MELSLYKLKSILVGILIPMMILMHASNPFVNTNRIYMIYIMIIVVSLPNSYKLPINKTSKIIYTCVILSMFVVPIFAFNIDSFSSVIYALLLIVFLFVADYSGQILYRDFHRVINMWVYLGLIIVDILVITHIDEINKNTIFGVFYSSNLNSIRYRASFGFLHPNFASIAITTFLFCIYLKFKWAEDNREKIFSFILLIVHIIPLLCTGSRTAAISIVVFLSMEVILKFYNNIYSEKSKSIIIIFILLLILISATSISSKSTMSAEDFSDLTSGRYGTIMDNLKILSDQGKIWFGNTVSSVSNANSSLALIGATTSDNWYYLQIARFGIVGTAIFMLCIVAIFINQLKSFGAKKIDSVSLSSMISLLVYGFGENVVYNQGVSLCAVVWIVLFMEIYKSEQLLY
ncbi:MAG: hypothetical protein ACI4I7_02585 [Oscillospiraceae bacterium]